MKKGYFINTLAPKKSLGQNFLSNPRILDKIVAAAELTKDDVVLEVGPGRGDLTAKISEKAGRVIAVEKDRRFIEPLRERFKDSNVEIIEADILKLKTEILAGNYKIVANLPYYITSHFLKNIFDRWPRPSLIVLMVQKEVARRIVAKPPHMNLLALSVQFYAEPKIVMYVDRNNFRPTPNVDSAVIKFTPKENTDEEKIVKALGLAKKAFAGKRKQLKNTIGSEILSETEIKPTSRPEELSFQDWLKIT